jgi:hypothetical protein
VDLRLPFGKKCGDPKNYTSTQHLTIIRGRRGDIHRDEVEVNIPRYITPSRMRRIIILVFLYKSFVFFLLNLF